MGGEEVITQMGGEEALHQLKLRGHTMQGWFPDRGIHAVFTVLGERHNYNQLVTVPDHSNLVSVLE